MTNITCYTNEVRIILVNQAIPDEMGIFEKTKLN